jgi:hypothetical protein
MRHHRLLLACLIPLLLPVSSVLASEKTTQQYLDDGNKLLVSGKYSEALTSFDAAISKLTSPLSSCWLCPMQRIHRIIFQTKIRQIMYHTIEEQQPICHLDATALPWRILQPFYPLSPTFIRHCCKEERYMQRKETWIWQRRI